jgi:hypothetical protein
MIGNQRGLVKKEPLGRGIGYNGSGRSGLFLDPPINGLRHVFVKIEEADAVAGFQFGLSMIFAHPDDFTPAEDTV